MDEPEAQSGSDNTPRYIPKYSHLNKVPFHKIEPSASRDLNLQRFKFTPISSAGSDKPQIQIPVLKSGGSNPANPGRKPIRPEFLGDVAGEADVE